MDSQLELFEEEHDLSELYLRDRGLKFSKSEVEFILRHLEKQPISVRYAFQKVEKTKFGQIIFIIDQIDNSPRRSAMENAMEVFCTDKLHPSELREMAENYGCNNRRFIVYYYKTIEELIAANNRVGAITPKKFIDECKKRGFTNEN